MAATLAVNINAAGAKLGAAQADLAFKSVSSAAQLADLRIKAMNQQLLGGSSIALTFGQKLAALAPIIGSLVSISGLAAIALKAITTAAKFESVELQFTTLLHSADLAKKTIADLEKFSVETPFQFAGLADVSKQLVAFGFKAQELIPILRDVGDTAAAVGGDQAEQAMNSIAQALGRIQNSGKLTAREMMELTTQGVPAWRYLADAIGTSVAEAQKRVEQGSIGSQAALKALREGMQKDFGGGMEALSHTTEGMISNIKDSFYFTLRDVGKALIEAFDVHGLLQNVMDEAEKFKHLIIDTVQSLAGLRHSFADAGEQADALAAHIRAVAAATAIVGGTIVALSAIEVSVKAIAAAWKLVTGAMAANPVGAVLVGISLLVAGIVAAYEEWRDVTVQIGDTNATVGEFVQATWHEVWADLSFNLEEFAGSLDELWEGQKDLAKSLFDGMGFSWSDLWSGMLDTAKTGINFVIAGVKSIVDFLSVMANRLYETVSAFGNLDFSSWEGFKKGIGETKDALYNALNMKTANTELVSMINDEFNQDFVGPWIENMSEGFDSIGDYFTEGYGNLWNRITNRANVLASQRRGKLQEEVNKAAADALSAAVSAGMPEAGGGRAAEVDPVLQEVIDKTKQLKDETSALTATYHSNNIERQVAMETAQALSKHINTETKEWLDQMDALRENLKVKAELAIFDKNRDLEQELSLIGKTNEEKERSNTLLAAQRSNIALLNPYLQRQLELISAIAKAQAEYDLKIKTQDLQNEIDTIGQSNTEREISKQLLDLERQHINLNSDAVQNLVAKKRELNQVTLSKSLHDETLNLEEQSSLLGKSTEERQVALRLFQLEQEGWTMNAEAVGRYKAALEKATQVSRIQEAADNISNAFGQSFEDIILGTKSVSEAFKALAQDIIKEMLRAAVIKPLVSALSTGLGGFAGAFMNMGGAAVPAGVNPSGAVMGGDHGFANGGLFMGGTVIPYATGGIVGQPSYFPMSGGRTGLMGEAGPEAILPLQRGADGKLGLGGSHTTVNLTYNITSPNADSFRKSQAQTLTEAKRHLSNLNRG